MYSIQTVIVGVPFTRSLEKFYLDDETEEAQPDPEEHGWTMLYNGCGGLVGYCGVKLGELDETHDWVQVVQGHKPFIRAQSWEGEHSFDLRPTPEQLAEAVKKVRALPEDVIALCREVGVYLIYHHS